MPRCEMSPEINLAYRVRYLEEKALAEKDNDDNARSAEYYLQAAELMHKNFKMEFALMFFEKAANCYEQFGHYFEAGDIYKRCAELYHKLNNVEREIDRNIQAADCYDTCQRYSERAKCINLAAEVCFEEKFDYEVAGELFEDAAETELKCDPQRKNIIVENYNKSILSFIEIWNRETQKKYNAVYEKFLREIDEKEFDIEDQIYFERIISALNSKGLHEESSKIYIHKMERICNYKYNDIKEKYGNLDNWRIGTFIRYLVLDPLHVIVNTIIRNVKYVFHPISEYIKFLREFLDILVRKVWGITSDFGENLVKWFMWVTAVVFVFAMLYMPAPFESFGILELKNTTDSNFVYTIHQSTFDNCITAFTFSVSVFTLFGIIDVVPGNSIAKIVIDIEILFGLMFLGIFLTILARKLFRNL